MNKKEFKALFRQYDKKGIYTTKDINNLYNHLIEVYGEVNEDNFNIFYAIDNKDLVGGLE